MDRAPPCDAPAPSRRARHATDRDAPRGLRPDPATGKPYHGLMLLVQIFRIDDGSMDGEGLLDTVRELQDFALGTIDGSDLK